MAAIVSLVACLIMEVDNFRFGQLCEASETLLAADMLRED